MINLIITKVLLQGFWFYILDTIGCAIADWRQLPTPPIQTRLRIYAALILASLLPYPW